MNGQTSVWLGHLKSGGRLQLGVHDLQGGICLLGRASNELATTIAYACDEAGLNTAVVDAEGFSTRRISGRAAAYQPSYFLYDVMKMDDENPNFHGQLIASAYSTSLDLSFEQEAALGAVCQSLALEEGIASPIALAERLEGEDAGGNASKRLRARLNSLSSLSIVGEAGVTVKALAGSAIFDLSSSMTPEVAELSAALIIAKLLALARRKEPVGPDVLVLLHANRLFKGRPIFRQNLRLLSAFVAHPVARVLASDIRYGLDDRFLDTSATKILSSDVWNGPGKEQMLAPGMFAMRDGSRGFETVFVPRTIEHKAGKPIAGTQPQTDDSSLVRDILDTVSVFGDGTRHSLVSYLATGRPAAAVERELERLINEGYVLVVTKKEKGMSPRSVLKLSAKGTAYLKGRT
jgi:hypothetical protein